MELERIVVRVDLDPAGADAVQLALGLVLDRVIVELGQDPPVHTKRALEAQREHLEAARRAVVEATANPVAIDDQGQPLPEL